MEPRVTTWVASLLFVAATALSGSAAPLEDQPVATAEGSAGGYEVPGTGLWLGGFATLEVEVPKSRPALLDLGDMGVLIRYQLTPTLTFFNETDLDDVVTLESGKGIERGSRVLLLERLYLDWSVTPQLTVRGGKFLTPFGIWNVIRRAPLTWTVDRPVATQSAFPDHTTWLGLIYQTTRHGWSLDATAYGQAQDELVRGASDISATAVGGGRMVAGHTLGPASLAVGVSGVAFDDLDTNRWEDSYGTDFDLTIRGNHLQGEFAYTKFRNVRASQEWSFYLQEVVPLYRELYGVLRFEFIDPRTGSDVTGPLIGLAWRVLPHVILKADYQFANHEGGSTERSALERGFLASVTVFFQPGAASRRTGPAHRVDRGDALGGPGRGSGPAGDRRDRGKEELPDRGLAGRPARA